MAAVAGRAGFRGGSTGTPANYGSLRLIHAPTIENRRPANRLAARKKIAYISYQTQTDRRVALEPAAIRAFIRRHLTRDQLADDLQMLRAARRTGGRLAEGGGLRGKGALRVAGYTAHEAYEQLFRDNVPLHGGMVADDLLPGTDVVVHQAVAVYGPVFVARATIGRSRDLPTGNATRRNAARLNEVFDPQGRLDLIPPPAERCFVLLLTRRDPADIGAYDGIDLAVLMSDFSGFSLYDDADAFLAGYGEAENTGDAPPGPAPKRDDMGIALRPNVAPFEGGEHGIAGDPAGSQNEGAGGT